MALARPRRIGVRSGLPGSAPRVQVPAQGCTGAARRTATTEELTVSTDFPTSHWCGQRAVYAVDSFGEGKDGEVWVCGAHVRAALCNVLELDWSVFEANGRGYQRWNI